MQFRNTFPGGHNYADPFGLCAGNYIGGIGAVLLAGYFLNIGYDCAGETAKITDKLSRPLNLQGTGIDNTSWNAVHHCIWNCEMVKRCGTLIAALSGWGHELVSHEGNGDLYYPINEDGISSIMDLYNNKQGRECGTRSCDNCSSCIDCCKEKLNKNELFVLDPWKKGSEK
jgi:hypothetical protein